MLLEATRSSHVFRSGPDQRWTVRVRTRNSAGHSPWSTSVSAATVSAASASMSEPIEGPFVTFVHGMPRLSWRGREGADAELVDHFTVEWRKRTEHQWNELGTKVGTERKGMGWPDLTRIRLGQVPFAGWLHPYSADLDQLPPGHVYEVRVRAVDHNMGTAFVSGTVTSLPFLLSLPSHTIRHSFASEHCPGPGQVLAAPIGASKCPCDSVGADPSAVELAGEEDSGKNEPKKLIQGLSEAEWNCDRLWYVVKYSSAEAQVG